MTPNRIIIGIFLLFLVFTIGCNKIPTFKSYMQVTEYCYQQNLTDECGLEKCIMLNSAEFNSDIKSSAENSYYKCKLIDMQSE